MGAAAVVGVADIPDIGGADGQTDGAVPAVRPDAASADLGVDAAKPQPDVPPTTSRVALVADAPRMVDATNGLSWIDLVWVETHWLLAVVVNRQGKYVLEVRSLGGEASEEVFVGHGSAISWVRAFPTDTGAITLSNQPDNRIFARQVDRSGAPGLGATIIEGYAGHVDVRYDGKGADLLYGVPGAARQVRLSFDAVPYASAAVSVLEVAAGEFHFWPTFAGRDDLVWVHYPWGGADAVLWNGDPAQELYRTAGALHASRRPVAAGSRTVRGLWDTEVGAVAVDTRPGQRPRIVSISADHKRPDILRAPGDEWSVVAEGGGGVTPSTAVHVLHLNADLSQIADPIRLNGDTPGSGDCLEHVAAAWGDEALGVAWVEGCQGLRTLRFSQVRVVRGDTEGL